VIVGDFIADLVINDHLICELKAIATLAKADEVQVVNYLTATNHDVGLLRRPVSDPASVDLHHPVNPV